MFVIGIDPHKGSHTAAVLDRDEQVRAELRVRADRHQRDRLLRWAESFEPRTWAIEAASGLGSLLAQQLLAAGEVVVDVPPTLSARARLLDSGNTDKTDPHDARSAAVVALRHPSLRVVAREDYSAVLRLQAKRHHDLIALRTQAVCRLHALLCLLVPGGLPRRLSATRAAAVLGRIRPTDMVSAERRHMAAELLAEVRRLDRALAHRAPRRGAHRGGLSHRLQRRRRAVPLPHHYARYNGTAPIEASSGPKKRHRLNPRGNRQLNHAIHMVAVTQVRNNTAGRAYYLRKQEEGKTRKEAMRALKRRISNAVHRQLVADAG